MGESGHWGWMCTIGRRGDSVGCCGRKEEAFGIRWPRELAVGLRSWTEGVCVVPSYPILLPSPPMSSMGQDIFSNATFGTFHPVVAPRLLLLSCSDLGEGVIG